MLAIDHGTKRMGLAISDELGIIASALDTVPAGEVFNRLKDLLEKEPIQEIVVGLPRRLNLEESQTTIRVREFVRALERKFPGVKVHTYDERLTSKIAAQTMLQAGARKKQRRTKEILDKISATVILQDFLASRQQG